MKLGLHDEINLFNSKNKNYIFFVSRQKQLELDEKKTLT